VGQLVPRLEELCNPNSLNSLNEETFPFSDYHVERIDLPVAHKMKHLQQGGNSGFQRAGMRKSSRARRLVRVLKMNARSLHPVKDQAPAVIHEPSKAA
jgi:hypothetical protein